MYWLRQGYKDNESCLREYSYDEIKDLEIRIFIKAENFFA